MFKLPVEVHPAAQIFPMLEGDEYEAFKADIKKNGVLVGITFYDGKLLDGRNRYRACMDLGIDPKFHSEQLDLDLTPDPIAWVISMNAARRHLSTGQRALVGLEAEKLYEAEAKKRQKASGGDKKSKNKSVPDNCPEPMKGDARDQAGKAAGVSGKSIDRAKKVVQQGAPELKDALAANKVSLHAATNLADLPKDEQKQVLAEGPKAVRDKVKEVKESKPKPVPTPKQVEPVEEVQPNLLDDVEYHDVDEIESLPDQKVIEAFKNCGARLPTLKAIVDSLSQVELDVLHSWIGGV